LNSFAAALRTACRRNAVFAWVPLLGACSSGVLDPHGPIGGAERAILIDATVIMLAVVVPIIGGTLAIAWWYRAGNRKARRLPQWSYSGQIEFVVWSIPALIILFLGGIDWLGSHDLDPAKPIQSKLAPLDIEVVSLDWKWLFIYPHEEIASVNRLVIPAGTPLRFRLTSATVMNSFFVPQLGSQIYTMAGMTTRLNLQADHPGSYQGLSAQFSGAGFSDMRFDVVALPLQGFQRWVGVTRAQGRSLDLKEYASLARASQAELPVTFGSVSTRLFEEIVANHGATPRIAQEGQ
jgi:cytochrome o ubiquinol oxidase subunit 2